MEIIWKWEATAFNEAVLRQAGCTPAETFVVIWRYVARLKVCEAPLERKAANTLHEMADKIKRIVNFSELRQDFLFDYSGFLSAPLITEARPVKP